MFFIPLIGGVLGLFGVVVIGGTVYCAEPYCCEDDFVYNNSDYSDYSDYE
jgi:hypothetical protein